MIRADFNSTQTMINHFRVGSVSKVSNAKFLGFQYFLSDLSGLKKGFAGLKGSVAFVIIIVLVLAGEAIENSSWVLSASIANKH